MCRYGREKERKNEKISRGANAELDVMYSNIYQKDNTEKNERNVRTYPDVL